MQKRYSILDLNKKPVKLPIFTIPHPILRMRAKRVTEINQELSNVIEQMVKTMYSHRGVGIAAPQIGINLRIIAWDFYYRQRAIKPRPYVLINPQAHLPMGGNILLLSQEACLSCPGKSVKIMRYEKITVTGMQLNGVPKVVNAVGPEAFVLQHEIDHLNGKLIIDHLQQTESGGIIV